MPIFETHAHYDSSGFHADRDEVLSALPAAGVGLVVDPGCDLASSRAALALAERYPFVYAAAGIHPSDCAGTGEAEFTALRSLCGRQKGNRLGLLLEGQPSPGLPANGIPAADGVGGGIKPPRHRP